MSWNESSFSLLFDFKNEYNSSPDEELIGMCPVDTDKPIAGLNTLTVGGTPADWQDHNGLILKEDVRGAICQSVGFWEVVDKRNPALSFSLLVATYGIYTEKSLNS